MATLIKTIKVKLNPTPEQAAKFSETLRIFSQTCNHISQIAHEHGGVSNKVSLHHLSYRTIRSRFPSLPAQLCCTARDKVAEAYKRKKRKLHRFGSYTAVRLDARTLSITRNGLASISTTQSRLKCEMILGPYQRTYLEDPSWRRTGAGDFVYAKTSNTWFVHVVLSREIELVPGSTPLGVDLGLKHLAVTSTGHFFPGAKAKDVRSRYHVKRAMVQAKGTRGAKRLLQRMSGREQRFMAHLNHTISRRIVREAQTIPGPMIVLEDLRGIRERIKTQRAQRRSLHNWNFAQLRGFIEYKALEAGIPVVTVDPRHTSQRCSRCGHLDSGQRNGLSFRCKSCGYALHADLNGARNIAASYTLPAKGCAVTQPRSTCAVVSHS